jgi:hypothetical protein
MVTGIERRIARKNPDAAGPGDEPAIEIVSPNTEWPYSVADPIVTNRSNITLSSAKKLSDVAVIITKGPRRDEVDRVQDAGQCARRLANRPHRRRHQGDACR